MNRTERRRKTKEEIIPQINTMLAAMDNGNSSESEVRIHDMELVRTV